jgi:uncharacterized membrane protein YcaP (DUF421 family)
LELGANKLVFDWVTVSRWVLRPIAIYIAALALVRILGKRALGQLSLFDLVIMAGIGDVIVVIALERQIPFEKGLFILGLLGGLELFLSKLTFRSTFFARLLEGKPTLLIKDGELIEQNLAKEHISRSDLRQELRKLGVANISQVAQGVLEACGNFSVILKDEKEECPLIRVSGPLELECPVLHQLHQEVSALHTELKNLQEIIRSKKED